MPRPAYFNDGRTAKRHVVTCSITDAFLEILNEDGEKLDRWPLSDIRATDGKSSRRFQCDTRPARLTLADDDDGAWLWQACPNALRLPKSRTHWRVWAISGVAAVASLVGIFLVLIPSFSSAVVGLIPYGVERRMGLETRTRIVDILSDRETVRVCEGSEGLAILQKRADAIAAVLESPFDIDVTVIRFPVANALTLPGGQVIILSGLFDKAKSGDEVIGILAHEIAHTVRRDPLHSSVKQTGTALLLSLLIGDVFGGAALTGVAATLIESGYSRDAEAASDALAVTALNRMGLSALPLADFLARIDKENGTAGIPNFLSTHPSGETREAAIKAASQGVGRSLNSYEWDAVKSMCPAKE